MITLIGTGHVFDLREQIIQIFNERLPDIICVELDERRYTALLQRNSEPKKTTSSRNNASFLYRLLGRFQDSIASQYGVQAGDEMLTSIQFAHDHQIPIAFIDVPADRMFSRMLKEMSVTEKLRLIISALGSMFVSKNQVDKEIDKIEMNLEKYLNQVGDKFPTIKRVLIDERNQHMVQQLIKAQENYENVIAIVGDGHIPGLESLLEENNHQCETIRLKQIRTKSTVESDSSQASFTVYHS